MNIFRYLDRWLSAPSFWAMWTAMEARKIVLFVSNLVAYSMYYVQYNVLKETNGN